VAVAELSGPPRFSVVVPTHRRRDLALRLVRGLDNQEFADFEAIVVIDGAGDGTAEALHDLETSFPLTVMEQPHRGPAAARNAGAAAAAGDVLLFLDDDMLPDSALLAEHDRSHHAGADIVLGHIPLDPDSPPTAVAAAVGRWAERRAARLSMEKGEVPVPDLLTGQMSVGRLVFERLGGFDVAFAHTNEDLDFGYRARKAGYHIVFNSSALSHQYYDVDAAEYTRRSRDGARGNRLLAARHPEIACELWHPQFTTPPTRLLLGALVFLPAALAWPLRALAVWSFSRRKPGRLSSRFFFEVQTMERLRGAREAERALRAPIAVVLAYHSIADLSGDPVLGEYGVTPTRFESQLDLLGRSGWQFVGLDDFIDAFEGAVALPDRAVLLTFDDAYDDFLTAALPILSERELPAVVFAVADRIGGTNDWRRSSARELRLLDAQGLREIADADVAVGSHGATHRSLIDLDEAELEHELVDSAERIAAIDLPRPAVFAYPYGEWNPSVATAVERAGYQAAFTIEPGPVRRSHARYALPRLEVLANDSERVLLRKIRLARLSARLRR
jgi:peptidoglycan/xylan/chitin deacetylase (PgdA/CDA1 family)/GT2 family glycosyltransferase